VGQSGLTSEVYDSKDEHLSEWEKFGDAPSRGTSEAASDHLPIVAEFKMSD
jgi:hypothetical protein